VWGLLYPDARVAGHVDLINVEFEFVGSPGESLNAEL
jgi:hypothetical protein